MSDTARTGLIGYTPISDMYAAAKELLQLIDGGTTPCAPSAALDSLRNCVKACDESIAEREKYAHTIAMAQDENCTDELSIDDNAVLSIAEGDGVWVSSWQWMPWWSTIDLKPKQIVWRSETDIELQFEPVSAKAYDEDAMMSRLMYFLGSKAEAVFVGLDEGGSGTNYIYADLLGIKIADLGKLGLPVIDGRDS